MRYSKARGQLSHCEHLAERNVRFCAKCNGHERGEVSVRVVRICSDIERFVYDRFRRNDCEKAIDKVEDYPLLECIAPLQGQALPTVNARQSNVLHFVFEEEGIGRFGITQEDDYPLLECTVSL